MGASQSSPKKDPLMCAECFEARKKVQTARERYLQHLREECDKCDDDIHLEEEHSGHDEVFLGSPVDSTQFVYPFENLIFEGGGAKGLTYCGVGRALEEHGILSQIHRFAGASIGAIVASLLSVGYNSYDVEHIMGVNMEAIVNDATYGYFSLIPNLIYNYGWNPGNKFMNFLGDVLAVRTGNPDITFLELYKKFGNELCVVVANVNTMSEEYCHVKTTPNMSVRKAVRMSMSLPGIFQAMKHKMFGDTNLYIDGGMICNYPIHCFDGWWLSMDPKDSFLQKIQPIKDIQDLLDKENRFHQDDGPIKTLGCMIFSSDEKDYYKSALKQKSGVPRGELPDTKLARAWAKQKRGEGKLQNEYEKASEASFAFLKVLRLSNTDGNAVISKDEFKNAFKQESFSSEHRNLLFGVDCDENVAFQAVDRDGNGQVTFNEIVNFVEEQGVCIHEKYLGYKRSEISGFLNFLGSIFTVMGTNLMRIFIRSSDVDRTIGINTHYIKTNDFGLESADKKFILDQGYRSTVKYLQNFASENKLQKASDKDVKSRKIPNKTTLTDEQIGKLLKI